MGDATLPAVTESDILAHRRKGARDELTSAKLLFEGGQYPGALFHCHLATEKALKALYMAEHRKEPPFTHDLLQIALLLPRAWTDEEQRLLADLTGYAIAARYDDPPWAAREATQEKVADWITRVETLLSTLLP
jgi:HEPN domain-containing protein